MRKLLAGHHMAEFLSGISLKMKLITFMVRTDCRISVSAKPSSHQHGFISFSIAVLKKRKEDLDASIHITNRAVGDSLHSKSPRSRVSIVFPN